jgi:hypothetical protein
MSEKKTNPDLVSELEGGVAVASVVSVELDAETLEHFNRLLGRSTSTPRIGEDELTINLPETASIGLDEPDQEEQPEGPDEPEPASSNEPEPASSNEPEPASSNEQ